MSKKNATLSACLNEIKEGILVEIEDMLVNFDDILEEYEMDEELRAALEEINKRLWRFL